MRNRAGLAAYVAIGIRHEGTQINALRLDANSADIKAACLKIVQPLARVIFTHAPEQARLRIPHSQTSRSIK
ncbi:MAG: hypothetical protein A2Z03_04800 [Chloroflexi bacterium RBG_16_56_8]|nr:MAG: hypothetical protein A2Z03_04800 [Chloroflexi bacterium RBG_16_56_8]